MKIKSVNYFYFDGHGVKIELTLPAMSKISVSIPKGTRDFGPDVMAKRKFLFDTIQSQFECFGFLPLETPTMENYSTLTGKYGEEGDQLLFKVLNNGEFSKGVDEKDWNEKNHKALVGQLCDRALRYDLTVPFARYVAMNHGQMTFPFKRYKIQPVWRADRPQKGRYREFYQCDADIIGTTSLWCEWELVKLYDAVFQSLKIPVVIHVNNRKVLQALASACGLAEHFMDMTIALDKLDKIGWSGVEKEMTEKGISIEKVQSLQRWLSQMESDTEGVKLLMTEFGSDLSQAEVAFFNQAAQIAPLQHAQWKWDFTLARGLNYYTGFIFEVKATGVDMGSIGGGGRYDDLTGIFGVSDLSGVGISFGADRIYDVMEMLQLFPEHVAQTTQVFIAYFSDETVNRSVQLLYHLRSHGMAAEMYPEAAKMKKQFKYADDRNIPFVLVIGDEELAQNQVNVKNMLTGEQKAVALDEILNFLNQD
jgi:histidyl-tRNA synthetase